MKRGVVLFPVNPGMGTAGFPIWSPPGLQIPALIAGSQIESMLADLSINKIPLRDEVNHTDVNRLPIPGAAVQRVTDASQLKDSPPIMGRAPGVGLMDMMVNSINQNRSITAADS